VAHDEEVKVGNCVLSGVRGVMSIKNYENRIAAQKEEMTSGAVAI
jgi:hypothetical protein